MRMRRDADPQHTARRVESVAHRPAGNHHVPRQYTGVRAADAHRRRAALPAQPQRGTCAHTNTHTHTQHSSYTPTNTRTHTAQTHTLSRRTLRLTLVLLGRAAVDWIRHDEPAPQDRPPQLLLRHCVCDTHTHTHKHTTHISTHIHTTHIYTQHTHIHNTFTHSPKTT